ncbi:hypothetical protein FO519_005560 [Halicephalobus sp. NKZ332]|nr:hypothetical protein FO519_005560 [Halicephalobus sp. NKZ332]
MSGFFGGGSQKSAFGGQSTSLFGGGAGAPNFGPEKSNLFQKPSIFSNPTTSANTVAPEAPKPVRDYKNLEVDLDELADGTEEEYDESRDLDDQGDDVPDELFTDVPVAIDSLGKYVATVKWYIDKNNWTATLLISDLFSLRDPHANCKFLQVENPNIPINPTDKNSIFTEIVSCHLSVLYYVSKQDWHKAYCMQMAITTILFEQLIKKTKGFNWFFPLTYPLCSDLMVLAKKAEALQVRMEEDTENYNEDVTTLVMNIYRSCVSDPEVSPNSSKKIVIFQLTLLLFQIYFETNRIALLKPLIRAVDNLIPSFRSRINLSELVTYNFYLGKKAMIDADLSIANRALEYAFTYCPEKYFDHKKRILLYWIPVKMFLGEIPTTKLLEEFGFPQFKEIAEGVRDGNIRLFRKAVLANREFLMESGVYLMFEKLIQIAYLSLLKRLVTIHGGNKLKLSLFTHLLKYQGENVDSTEDTVCILSNLIAKKKVKEKYPILSDPRICKGSVVARQREEALRIQKELEIRDAEERYRMEIVRNRLNLALGVNGAPGGPTGMRQKELSSFRMETNERLAKLAGKTGKIAIFEWAEKIENGIEKKSSPRRQKVPRRLSPIKKEVSTVHEDSFFEKKVKKNNLRNVKFVPLKETTNGVVSGPLPSIPKKDDSFPKNRFRQIRKFNPSPFTPPQTPYGPKYFNDVSVQTDEAFEEVFDPMISEMADTAIFEALRNLKEEDEFRLIEEQNEKLLEIHELEKEKQIAFRKLTALDCRKIAAEFVDELVEKCIENMANRGLIDDTSKFRSVGADTRQLEKHQAELRKVTKEIQQDFFPYVYAKAEQIFVHKLADSYLRDALFSKNLDHKVDARSKLNEQIQKYQELTKGIRLSSYKAFPFLQNRLSRRNERSSKIEVIPFGSFCHEYDSEIISFGPCSPKYLRCTGNKGYRIESCEQGKVVINGVCESATKSKICFNTELNELNAATVSLAKSIRACDGFPGVLADSKNKCSRQGLFCDPSIDPMAFGCPEGFILDKNFSCKKEPSCGKSSGSTSIKNALTSAYCKYPPKEVEKSFGFSKSRFDQMFCQNWFIDCRSGKFIFCETGKIYDKKIGSCRIPMPEDNCSLQSCHRWEWMRVPLGLCIPEFVFCEGKTPTLFKCSDGKVFKDGTCVPPHNVPGCPICESGERKKAPHCREYFECRPHENLKDPWVLLSCPHDQFYNAQWKTCEKSKDGACADYSKCKEGDSYNPQCGDFLICRDGELRPGKCPHLTRWSKEQKTCVPDPSCKRYETDEKHCRPGDIIPSSDCEFFFVCDPKKKVYEKRSCTDSAYEKSSHPFQCGKVLECIDGRWKKRRCKKNMKFINGKCSNTLSCSTSQNPQDENLYPEIPEDENIYPEKPEDDSRPETSQGNDHYSQKSDFAYQDENDCTRYYIIENGKIIQKQCNNGQKFDESIGKCTFSYNCRKNNPQCYDGETQPHPENCEKYKKCFSGKYFDVICPYGSYYEKTQKTCVEGNCHEKDYPHDSCTESPGLSGFRQDKHNCRKFYQCANGKWVPKDCAPGTAFAPQLGVCDHIQNVPSCARTN